MDRIVAAAHITAPRLGNGVFVMTAHQAKGKEFDTVILADPLERHYQDTDEGRRLLRRGHPCHGALGRRTGCTCDASPASARDLAVQNLSTRSD
jgi:ATP-dependent exoDNAse (exonuclease V) beta subunit